MTDHSTLPFLSNPWINDGTSERVATSVARPDLYKRKSSATAADSAGDGGGAAAASGGKGKAKGKKQTQQYYRVTVRDNGVGMKHDDVPDMFGQWKCTHGPPSGGCGRRDCCTHQEPFEMENSTQCKAI